MFLYIYDHAIDDWIETNSLFPHDIALLIDNSAKLVYFYTGSKCQMIDRKKGLTSSQVILKKFPSYKLNILEDAIPLKIQSEIEILLGDNIDSRRFKEERTNLLKSFIGFSSSSILLFLIILFNTFLSLGWDHDYEYYFVLHENFNSHFSFATAIAWIILIILLLNMIVSIISKRTYLIASSIVNFAISLGTLLYLQKRINLFEFSAGESIYNIERFGVLLYNLILFIAFMTTTVVSILCIYFILTQTKIKEIVKQSPKDLKKSAKPTILQNNSSVKMKEIENPDKKKVSKN